MGQPDFAYAPANDVEGLPLTISVFADCTHIRGEIAEDVAAAGLNLRQAGPISSLIEGDVRPLGDVILLDCPKPDGAALAALSRLDIRAAQSGAHLIVSTSVDALDVVFACFDQSRPQFLVDPGRSERVIALGRVLARVPNLRLRELSESDRLGLLRLTEQVGGIAERLERLKSGFADMEGGISGDCAFRVESPASGYRGEHPPLPDPRLVRRIIQQRYLRGKFFDASMFADPAWDILLDLTAARGEHVRVSVTSLCIASGVPPTTALRWIGQMVDTGLLERVEDEADRRRAFIVLSDKAADAMARYFAEIGKGNAELV
jgi:hypothetical protein